MSLAANSQSCPEEVLKAQIAEALNMPKSVIHFRNYDKWVPIVPEPVFWLVDYFMSDCCVACKCFIIVSVAQMTLQMHQRWQNTEMYLIE